MTQGADRASQRSLLSAGLDTTVHGIGNALYCFANNPDQWAKLRETPALARSAFGEALRFESPLQQFFRTTTRPVAIEGMVIGANRDPRAWKEPDRFDITRRAAKNVALGGGIPFCVGAMLARLEAETIITALARKVRTISPAGKAIRFLNNSLRGLTSLPVTVERALKSTAYSRRCGRTRASIASS